MVIQSKEPVSTASFANEAASPVVGTDQATSKASLNSPKLPKSILSNSTNGAVNDQFDVSANRPKPLSVPENNQSKSAQGNVELHTQSASAPTLIEAKILPGLEKLQAKLKKLGKNPSPAKVDSSDVRRLIRALEPQLAAFSEHIAGDEFDDARKSLHAAARGMGHYKDVAVVEVEIAKISPKGQLPKKIKKELGKLRDKRQKSFLKAYAKLNGDVVAQLKSGLSSVANDAGMAADEQGALLLETVKKSLGAINISKQSMASPHDFHKVRKGLRTLLNAAQAAEAHITIKPKTLKSIKQVVDVCGEAQDVEIAREWAHDSKHKKMAAKLGDIYDAKQAIGVRSAEALVRGGVLRRVRAALIA